MAALHMLAQVTRVPCSSGPIDLLEGETAGDIDQDIGPAQRHARQAERGLRGRRIGQVHIVDTDVGAIGRRPSAVDQDDVVTGA
jgi:hypothetical protein